MKRKIALAGIIIAVIVGIVFSVGIIFSFFFPFLFDIFIYILVSGLPQTLLLTGLGLLGGFLLGISLALMRIYGSKELQWFSSGYEKLFRGIPIIVLIYIFAFGIPGIFWFIAPLHRSLAAVILALALRSGAYQSQIFRGAILSVNPGQMEAARSLGMNQLQGFRHIVMPQALRLAIPSWSNEYAVVIKDSSFASGIGIIELTKSAYRVSVAYREIPELWTLSMVFLTILYFLFTYPITRFIGERQTKKLKDLGMGGG
ncbi:MAG: amino acid ABC transporter permease [Candidatus Heimdallarchaeota archaeon]